MYINYLSYSSKDVDGTFNQIQLTTEIFNARSTRIYMYNVNQKVPENGSAIFQAFPWSTT